MRRTTRMRWRITWRINRIMKTGTKMTNIKRNKYEDEAKEGGEGIARGERQRLGGESDRGETEGL